MRVAQRFYGIVTSENRERSTLVDRKRGGRGRAILGASTAARGCVSAFSRSVAAEASVREGGIRRQGGPFRPPGLPAEADARDRPYTVPNAQRDQAGPNAARRDNAHSERSRTRAPYPTAAPNRTLDRVRSQITSLTGSRQMKPLLWSTLASLLVATTMHAQTRTIAERLGHPANSKLLILHADVLGAAHSENAASLDALDKGAVNSASIMIPTPWVTEVAEYAKKN